MKHFVDEKTVMRFYLEQMDADQILFLKEKDALKAQVRTNIEQLLNEDKMNNKISIACKLWKALFEAAMTSINPDKTGYDKLFKYFDSYVEFEELIFASDSFYRDHTLHCIWVYFLGEYLKRKEEFRDLFQDSENDLHLIKLMDELFTHIKLADEHKSNYQQFQIMSGMVHGVYNKDEVIRCISALTHDLGYPLKKIEKINKSIKKVLPFFSINDFNDFSFEYNNIQQEFAKKFVDFISRQVNINLGFKENDKKTLELFTKIVVTNEYGNVIHIDHDAITSLTKEEHEAILSAFSYEHSFTSPLSTQFGFWNDFEDYRHGIMSAFLLCKNVRAFQDIDYDVIRDDFRYRNTAELETLMAINQILTSISNHTSEQFKITSLTPNTFLTFIDELEEFSRISRASQNREYIEEFCDTALYMEEGWLNIDFEFNNENLDNLDPEISFKGRCKRFLSLFDVRNLSPNLKLRVRCIGKLPTDQNTYCLEIARNHADVLINSESMNIPKYLKANQFYTKEEYANNSHSA